jgi:Fe-S cluster assembly protein SufD
MATPTLPPTVETPVEQVDAAARYVEAFQMHDGTLLNGTNARLQGLRREALERFEALGFPHRKAEAWKYTNITRVINRGYDLFLGQPEVDVTAADVDAERIPELDAHTVVLVNGRFDAEHSTIGELPDGVRIMSLATAAEAEAELFNQHFAQYASFEDEVFTALNTAFAHDGVFVYVPERVVLETPLHVINLVAADDNLLVQPRLLLVVEDGAQFKMVQTARALGDGKTFTNVVTEAYVGRGAHVDIYEVQEDDAEASQVTNLQAYQEDDSVFRTSAFTFGGDVIRNNLNVLPNGNHCESHLYGLFLGHGASHIDSHTFVDHAQPDCFSNELYKGILDDQSTGVFNGKVLVRQDAQRINAYQSNKSIVLTETAQMYSKPELEIYADDVQCSHGATSGQLDEEGIFYLRSRGLSEERARAIMLMAFARDVVDTINIEPLRALVDEKLTARFRR